MIGRNTLGTRYPARKLADVVEFLDNQRRPVTESDRVPGPFPYYGANGVQGSIDKFLFDESLVLLAEDGGHFNDPGRGIAYRISGKTWVNNHAHVLRPKPCIDGDFLARVLENYDVTPFVTGTTRGKLTKAGASEILVPLPPLPEQRRIAAILDQADALRAKRREALAQLDSFTQSIFIEMFGDPAANPLGWPTSTLKTLGKVITGGTPPGGQEGMFDGPIPFLTPGDLESDAKPKRTVTDAGAAAAVTVRAGATLVCCIGATIGKTGIVRVRSAFNQQLNAVDWRPTVNDVYGLVAMRSLKAVIVSRGASTTLPILKKSAFEELAIAVPPLALQQTFATRIQAVEALKATHRAALAELDALFASLQHRAFAGQLS